MYKQLTDQEIEQAKLEVKSYLADRNRKSVFLDAVRIDGLLHYEFEVFEYSDKPQHLVVVRLIRQGITNSPLKPGWIRSSSSNSANESKVFEYVLINPCTSYISYRPITDNTCAAIEGYVEGNKLLYKLEYRQDSDYPRRINIFDDLIKNAKGTQNMKDAFRNRVFSSFINTGNSLVYEFDVFETDRCNVIEVKSGSSDLAKDIKKVTVFDPTEMKPCASYRLFKKLNDINTVGIEGYTADDKLAYVLEYNEESIYPTIFIDLDLPKKAYEVKHRVREGIPRQEISSIKPDEEQKKPSIIPKQDIKCTTNILTTKDGKVLSLRVETYSDCTCKMSLSKHNGIPTSKDTLIWSSGFLTTECDAYSVELFSNNDVKVYGSRDGFKDYKTFHWNEQGVLLSVSE